MALVGTVLLGGCTGTADPAATTSPAAATDPATHDEQDGVRPVPLVGDVAGIPEAERAPSSGASGVRVTAAARGTGPRVALVFEAPGCVAVADVAVVESRDEVRVAVLLGPSTDTDTCNEPGPQRVEVELDAPLGDRAVLDVAS